MGYLLHHLLSESAARTPEAPALRFEGEALDYGTLEARANRAARALGELGVAPGDRVGLHMRKTADAVVALLGVLKSGACVVPVNVTTPAPKLRDIVDQCAMRCLIGSPEACSKLDGARFGDSALETVVLCGPGAEGLEPAGIRKVVLGEAEAGQSGDPVPNLTVDTDLAYVLFTSGSTGSPKGVMLSHRAVLAFVEWAIGEFDVGPADRLSNHAPLNFDLSTFDVFAALGAGARLTVVPEGLSMFPARLAELIEGEAITVWYSVPSVLRLLCERGDLARRELGSLRLVLFAGEVFPVKHLRALMLALPAPRYFNLYGPTETNVCTAYEVERPPEPDAGSIPIGRACANTRTVVLDDSGAVVSEAGGEGVLHVAGSTLMDGYYGRPEESAAAFRPDPLLHGGDGRLYCTGDWVRIGADGEYRFLGRRDHMVKVGGYRVELGEVEAALHAHPAVSEAAAIAIPDEALGCRVGAVAVVADSTLDAQALKRHCAGLLPKYMVPAQVELRDSLPRTSTDKVDRPRLVAEIGRGVGDGG